MLITDDQSILDVIHRDGPEELRRRFRSYIEHVVIAAHQRVAVALGLDVHDTERVLGLCTDVHSYGVVGDGVPALQADSLRLENWQMSVLFLCMGCEAKCGCT